MNEHEKELEIRLGKVEDERRHWFDQHAEAMIEISKRDKRIADLESLIARIVSITKGEEIDSEYEDD